MIVVDNAAVGTDGHIHAGLLEILVSCGCNLDQSGCLAPADALGFPGDADGAAADAHLYEVRTGLSQEPEAVPVHHVARADLHGVAIGLAHPLDGLFLPAGVALGGVDDQHVHTGLQQGRNSLRIVPGVDARTHQIALLSIQQLLGVGLVRGVVLPEDEVQQVVVFVHDGQAVQLVLPDDVVGLFQRGLRGGGDQLLPGSHEGGNLVRRLHAGDPVVPAGHDAKELTVGGAVIGDGHGGEAVLCLQRQNICQSVLRGQIGSRGDEAGLVVLDPGDHGRLALNGLRAENEADAALLRQCNGQRVIGHRLHNGGSQGNVQGNGGLFLALAELDQRRLQADLIRDAILGSVAGHQKVLAEGVAGFGIVISHGFFSSLVDSVAE